ncbi:glycosyltransferase [Alicyclobacillus macrosporangiidus]|uniref:tetratricopeptide repeat-containing glycosyltransferase family 2 protein n=1 Tax=Alicyclobacillus macrosporangiidus TaxID=392015 RepID=UPI000A757523|nr:glycosyltransferase [Alicyclobacillus macrosporangiidus]
MIRVSLCMIVKNEEETLGRCLESVADLVDEIIIVDTGSTDSTKEIARKWTPHVLDFEWIDDFAAARNFSFSHASMEYILWLDADDVLLEPDRQKFLHLKQNLDSAVDVVSMYYHLAFDSEGNVTASLRRNRLAKRSKGFRWYGAVHEYLAVNGSVLNSDIAITHLPVKHDSDRNLRIYERRLAAGETFTPRDLFYYANECFDHQNYERAIEYYTKFLNSKQGWIEDIIATCGKLADCYFHLGDMERAKEYALKSFEYDTPRAEFCCRLGYGFMQQGEWNKAVFWYKLATEVEKSKDSWGYFNDACWTWLPHLQLCVCYYHLGEYELAYKHNEKARQYKPNDEQVLYNKNYLESILKT